MTIAVGFVCTEGIVVGADTKESYGGDMTLVNKIAVVAKLPENSMRPRTEGAYAAIVGSGDAYLIDYIVPRIKEVFTNSVDLPGFRKTLCDLMPTIYGSPAIANYPRGNSDDLYTQLLVAVRPNYEQKAVLFTINSSLVTEVETGRATIIGCGPMAETVNEFGGLNLNVTEATVAALYLINESKRHYSDVGGPTHIYTLFHEGVPRFERVWDQAQKEYLFHQLRALYNELIITTATPTQMSDDRVPFPTFLKNMAAGIREIHNEFLAIERRHVTKVQKHRRKIGKQIFGPVKKKRN